jgi:thiaminase
MKKTKALVNRLIEEIEKHGIIQSACDKHNISRQSFYRWMKEDKEFLELVDEALSIGVGVTNDIALSNVLIGIKNKDVGYTTFWLKHRHTEFRRPYRDKVDPDVLAQFRYFMQVSKMLEIQNNATDFVPDSYKEMMEQAGKDAEDFFAKFGVPVKDTKPKGRKKK